MDGPTVSTTVESERVARAVFDVMQNMAVECAIAPVSGPGFPAGAWQVTVAARDDHHVEAAMNGARV